MTVSTQARRIAYVGNSVTVTYAVPFPWLVLSDLRAYRRDSAGNEQTIAIASATGGNGLAGNVTLVTAPGSGYTLYIERTTPLTQETDYTPNDPFPAASHERALDKAAYIDQEAAETIARAVLAPVEDGIGDYSLVIPKAADRASKVFAWDADGNPTTATQDPGAANANGIDWTDAAGNTHPIEHKLRQTISIADFGAVGDYNKTTYAGTDNATAIQSAATYAASIGATLTIPHGSFYLGSSVNIQCNVIGPGEICIDHKTSLYATGYGGSIASIANAFRVSASKLKIEGVNFWAPGRHLYDPVLSGAVNGGMYSFLFLLGTVGTPSVGQSVHNCYFYGGHFASVLIGSYTTSISIDDNRFEGNGYHILYDTQNAGLNASNSSKFSITNNRFRATDWAGTATSWATTNTAWGGDCIEINAPVDGVSDVYVDGNTIQDIYSSTTSGGIGIGLAKVTRFIVSNNTIRNTYHDGIHIEDSSSRGIVGINHSTLNNVGTGGGSITSQESFGIEFIGNHCDTLVVNGAGAGGYAGPFLADTSEHVSIKNNWVNSVLYVINQSNISVISNDVHRVGGSAAVAGQNGIDITVGPATAVSGMKNIIVEGNRVSRWYNGIAVVAASGYPIDSVRVRQNYCTSSVNLPVSINTYVTNYEESGNESIGESPSLRKYNGVAEAAVVGIRGDICTNKAGTYGDAAWLKRTGDLTDTGWIPLGHLGFFIQARTDGTAISAWARHVRYTGTGGHNFDIEDCTETGRLLTFENCGTGAAITVTPDTDTIEGAAVLSIPPGRSVTIGSTYNGDWKIQYVGGRKSGWATPTGTLSRAAFDQSTVTLPELAQRVAALITDLKDANDLAT